MSPELSILVADADEEVRLTLVETIQELDPTAKIVEVGDGAALDAALAQGRIDIVFVDVVLPQTNGANIVAWREAAGPRSMIVLVSDLLASGWPTVARRMNAYDVMLKPLGDQQIARVLAASRIIRQGMSLLVVDPRDATQTLITRLLAQSHFTFAIDRAATGRQALRLAQRKAYDVVMIEVGMTDYPALELACQINTRTPETKLALMGFEIEPRLSRQLGTFGISTFLKKPFYFADIDKAFHQIFGLWHPYLITALQAVETEQAQSHGADVKSSTTA